MEYLLPGHLDIAVRVGDEHNSVFSGKNTGESKVIYNNQCNAKVNTYIYLYIYFK